VKYGIDLFVATFFFHRPWEIWNYFFPGGIDVLSMTFEDKLFFFTLLILALPFIWVGVVLTMRRLRAAQLPVQLVKLFFVPFLNVLLFGLLCLLPTQELEPLKLTADSDSDRPPDAGNVMAESATAFKPVTKAAGPAKRVLAGMQDAKSDAAY